MAASGRSAKRPAVTAPAPAAEVTIRLGRIALGGRLAVPAAARGIVLFAHGSGSSRHSPRNQAVAGVLQAASIGTLLADLLTVDEATEDAATGVHRFNLELLSDRVLALTDWLVAQPAAARLPIGYFGASTGAGAALLAAPRRVVVRAIVSRGGRPDLAAAALPLVQAPTLLIVGARDVSVLPLNEQALSRLGAPIKQLETIPGATHLFEEPGALERVAQAATSWFLRYLAVGVVSLAAVLPAVAQPHEHGHGSAGAAPSAPVEHGWLGPYPMTRDASGTSWQPDATPMAGFHGRRGSWTWMAHGTATVVATDADGARGDHDLFSTTMGMGQAQRPVGPGALGLRAMGSLEPLTVGRRGYPELLQTGETADGRAPLIDRQHPHDLFMELASTYHVPVGAGALFGYLGWPGEPALGPPAFMHRFSGLEDPEAPLTHHWLDSTHITHGVATLGGVWDRVKLEGSVFTGREPDEDRWDLETPRFDSVAGRVSYNPTPAWAFQASAGHLDSPEQLEPSRDVDRVTASAAYHRAWGSHHWQTLAAWGRNRQDPGRDLDGWLLESTVVFRDTHTWFARAEAVEKDELVPSGDPRHGQAHPIYKTGLGYLYDFPTWRPWRWGIGAVVNWHWVPSALEDLYGERTPMSWLVFARVRR